MIKKIFLLSFLFLFVLYPSDKILKENRCTDDIEKLSKEQISVLLKAFSYGAKYDFGYTMAAIAWKESCAGEYKVNFQDPSAGIYHAYIPTVLKRYPSLKSNGLTQNMIGDKLINDDEFASQEALKELEFWKKVHNNNWKNIVKSYNRGYSWQKDKRANTQAEEYFSDIANKVKKFKGMLNTMRMERAKNRVFIMPIYSRESYNDKNFKLLDEY